MLFVPIEQVREGMVVAKSVEASVDPTFLPLLVKGHVLTERTIRKLKEKNIFGIYIDTDFTQDVEPKEIISPAVKQKALYAIKQVFEDVSQYNKVSIDNTRLITEIARDLVFAVLNNDEVLIDFLDLKGYDDYTFRHSLSVAIFSITIGRRLGYGTNVLTEIATAALLHDIGKTEISIDIINKPGKLTDEEYEIIKQHPEIAIRRLDDKKTISEPVKRGILSHHERYNGTGYPHGLSGDKIPMYGRILSVSDVYDALTSRRPYRKAWYPNEAIEYVLGCVGIHFDPEITNCFLDVIVPFPVGTLVELSNGCAAIVIKTNENKLRPVVRLFSVADDTSFQDIDMMHDTSYMNVTIVGLGYKNSQVDYDTFIPKTDVSVTEST